ncbi:TY-Chap domain-containing protein [Luteipulveratus mongoliensis]|uniref:TY-Chap N-terminal domain-containing protein n=1 Tax=Luteipulveratus mongoliensis TaxID=571913 RepID=A0A0K1JFM5_9MICO|nr:hypothetical protein [Luteipulveratus mongoliensis]AKU15522.1 hypothetical protein VV02_06045 [Luteipulveratus mongoliensis]
MGTDYRPLRLETASWESWQQSLTSALLANRVDDNIVIGAPPRSTPLTAEEKPSAWAFWRESEVRSVAAPWVQLLRDDDCVLLDSVAEVWSPDERESLEALGWPQARETATLQLWLPRTKPVGIGLAEDAAREAAQIVARMMRDVAVVRAPADLDVTQANVG